MILFCFFFFLCCAALPWQSGSFEIHIFDVGQGSSQLVVFPSGFSMLIDVKEGPLFFSHSGAELVAQKVEDVLGAKHINIISPSHLDLDHVGYATKGGIWSLVNEFGFTFDTLLDRDAGVWLDGDGDGKCDDFDNNGEFQWNSAGAVTGTMEKWVCWTTNSSDASMQQKRQLATPGKVFTPDLNSKITVVAANGSPYTANLEDGKPLSADHTAMSDPPGENEFSICLLLESAGIVYLSCGDIGGFETSGGLTKRKLDIETPLSALLPQVHVFTVNHHGSKYSTNNNFLDAINAKVGLVSCGSTLGHPTEEALSRLKSHNVDVYVVQECSSAMDSFSNVKAVFGDITVRAQSSSPSSFQVIAPNGTVLKSYSFNGTSADMSDSTITGTASSSSTLTSSAIDLGAQGNSSSPTTSGSVVVIVVVILAVVAIAIVTSIVFLRRKVGENTSRRSSNSGSSSRVRRSQRAGWSSRRQAASDSSRLDSFRQNSSNRLTYV